MKDKLAKAICNRVSNIMTGYGDRGYSHISCDIASMLRKNGKIFLTFDFDMQIEDLLKVDYHIKTSENQN